MPPTSHRDELAAAVAEYYDDPLGFVLFAWPWPINGEAGPDQWQEETLIEIGDAVKSRAFNGVDPVLPIRKALSTGNGVGKTALIAWLIIWLMSTRDHCHITVTANTETQLETKTWAAVREWLAKAITRDWFEINSQVMYAKGHRASWFATPISCKPENADAYRGQHAKASTSAYFLDEASGISDPIYVALEGGLTDGEPFVVLTGNMTRNTGQFHNAVFGKQRDRWNARVIDSRTAKFHNAALVAEWLKDYGEDSDFFRVNVRGLPPTASQFQYIDMERIVQAQRNPYIAPLPDEPLIAGVDVSDGGSAWTICRFRRGADARSYKPIRLPGQPGPDYRQLIIATLAERLRDPDPRLQIAAMFIDSAFGSPIVERLRQMGFLNVHEIRFGAPSPNTHDANQRAYQWRRMKEWLPAAMIDPEDTRLATDLGAPGYHLNAKDQLVMESKESMIKRGQASPDDGDALSLTHARVTALISAPAVVARPRLKSTWG